MFAPPPPPAPPHDAFVPDNPVEEEPQSDKVIAFLTKKYSEMLVDPAEARKDACLSFVVPDDDARYHNVTPISIDIYSCHQKLQGTCTDSTLKDPDAAFCDGLPQHLRCDGVEYGMLRVKRGVFVSWDVGWEYLKLCQVTKGGMPFRAYHALLVERFRSQGVPCDSLNYECIKQFLYSFLIFLELDYNKKCMLCARHSGGWNNAASLCSRAARRTDSRMLWSACRCVRGRSAERQRFLALEPGFDLLR